MADKAITVDGKQDKSAEVVKDGDRTTAAEDDDAKVSKASEKAKKTTLPLNDKTVDGAAGKKTKRNSSNDKIRRRRKHSSELQEGAVVNEKVSAPAASLELPQADGKVTAKETVPGKEGTVPGKEQRRHQSRRSAEVTNVTALQTGYPVDHNLSCGSGIPHAVGADASYGSEAVEDVIQRLLDDDELMYDVDQPAITSPDTTARRSAPGPAILALMRNRSQNARRKREKSALKPRKSPKSVPAQASAKSPGSIEHAPGKSETSSQPADATSDTEDTSVAATVGTSSGPRIKHVCRYASIALGKPVATFPPVTSSHLQLSALPSQEKERILGDKSPGTYVLTSCVNHKNFDLSVNIMIK